MTPGKGRKSPDEMTFLEHLEDLRKRLFYSVIALVIAVVPCGFFAKDLFEILAKPVTQFLPQGQKMVFLDLTAPFMLYMKTAFLAAAIFSSPFIFLQLWHFVAPGLYRKEKKYVFPFVFFMTVFFALGVLFGYKIVFPMACGFFIKLGKDFTPQIRIDQYFNFALLTLLGIGLVFELPTLIYFLSKIGVITARWMIKNFKYAVLVVFIIAAVITPTPDAITQSIVALPMLGLYGISILIALVVARNKARKRKKPESGDLAG